MKINQAQIQGALSTYQRQLSGRPQVEERSVPAPAKKPTDGVELSAEAQEIASLKQRLAETPGVREERVAELAKQVQSGTYRPPSREVAGRILDLGL